LSPAVTLAKSHTHVVVDGHGVTVGAFEQAQAGISKVKIPNVPPPLPFSKKELPRKSRLPTAVVVMFC